MRKTLTTSISLALAIGSLQAGQDVSGVTLPGSNDTSEGSPLFQFVGNVDWGHFGRMFQITGEFGKCTYKDDVTFGFRAALAAPIAIVETTQDYGYSITLQTNILGNKPRAAGDAIGDGGYVHVHAYGFNPLGELFKEDTSGLLCLPSGPIFTPLYFSELPLSFCNDDIKSGVLFADIVAMINPATVMAGLMDCVSSEALASKADDSLSGGWKGMARSVSGNYFTNGCLGAIPINCYTSGKDQIADAVQQSARILSLMHKTGVFDKTADFGLGDEPWCGSKEYLLWPKAQYQFQIAYPTVGETHQYGVAAPHFSGFANKISAKGGTALYVWQTRHYLAGATKCK